MTWKGGQLRCGLTDQRLTSKILLRFKRTSADGQRDDASEVHYN